MAGWVCQTRKLLQSAIATIADELEQTVQNFNDAVHNLSRPATNSSDNGEQTLDLPASEDDARETDPPQDLEYEMAAAQMLDLCKQNAQCSDQDFFASPHSLPTTRQPEMTGFATALNSRLSQSSPSLYLPRRLESRSRSSELVQAGRATGRACKFQPLAYRSTSPSHLSVSSPCLIHISRPARVTRPTSRSAQPQYSQSDKCNTEHHQPAKTKPSLCTASSSPAVCPRHNQDLSHSFGHKLPGKVVRAQRPPTPDELPKDELCLPSEMESEASKKPVPGSSADLSPTDDDKMNQESERSVVVRASVQVPALVERETRFFRWLSLAPLTRVLSFAFTQFANVVLKLTEEEYQSSGSQSSSPRELLALTDGASHGDASDGPSIHRRLSKDVDNSSEGQGLYSCLLRSTYSTESFEIIERSCFDGFHESSEISMVERTEASQNFDLGSRGCGASRVSASDIMSSSAEFVNFDFRDLIANRQFDKLNPVSPESAHTEKMYKSYVVIGGDKGPDILVTYNDKGDAETRNDGQHIIEERDNEEDDDDDGSVSFTILSSENDEEFIMF